MEIAARGFSKNLPSSIVHSCRLNFHTTVSFISSILSRSYPRLHLFSGACSSFVTLAPHLATDLFREMIAFSGSLKRDITGFYRPRYLLPQVPSKKAKLKESLLQIMDDQEDCSDKYLVRKLLSLSEPYLAPLSFFFFEFFEVFFFSVCVGRRRTAGSSRLAFAWSRRTTTLLIS